MTLKEYLYAQFVINNRKLANDLGGIRINFDEELSRRCFQVATMFAADFDFKSLDEGDALTESGIEFVSSKRPVVSPVISHEHPLLTDTQNTDTSPLSSVSQTPSDPVAVAP